MPSFRRAIALAVRDPLCAERAVRLVEYDRLHDVRFPALKFHQEPIKRHDREGPALMRRQPIGGLVRRR